MEKYINEILEQHGLEYVDVIRSAKSFNARSDLLIVQSGKKKYTAKIYNSKDEYAKKRFLHEIDSIKKARATIRTKYKSAVPHIRWFSKKNVHPYYIYDYIEGEPIGKFTDDYGIASGIFNQDNFEDFIHVIHEMSLLNIDVDNERRWGARYSKKELQHYIQNNPDLLPSSMYDEIQSFYERYHSHAFDRMILSHRDLYPENIIKLSSNKKKFVIIDWEYFGYVPIGFDAAILYVLFWKEEFWKAKVFSYYYNYYDNLEDKKLLNQFILSFRFCLAILCLRFLYQLHLYGKTSNEYFSHARESFIFDLRRALDGDIVKPRNVKYFINDFDIKKVARKYGIDDIKSYHISYASKGNTVAKVSTKNENYIFRFYSISRSKSLIKRELRIFETLRSAGIPTYTVIRSLENELFVSEKLYGKDRRIAVFSFVKGHKLKSQWLNEKSISNAATTLRQVHDCNIIHGDYSKENVLYIKSKVSGVIDFEWGRITKSRKAKDSDLAKAIALWLVDVRGKQCGPDEIMAFIDGYYDRRLSESKLKYLLELVNEKINLEKEIYLTTIDGKYVNEGGKRFNNAIAKINSLIPSDTD